MLSKVSTVMIIFLFLFSSLSAQGNRTVTGTIEYQVLTSDLRASLEPQILNLGINIAAASNAERINIRMTETDAKLTLLGAEKNGNALWLIYAQQNQSHENVLSWSFNDSSGVLSLYPYPDADRYTLQLEIQVNFSEKILAMNIPRDTVSVDAILAGIAFEATGTGRGNIITINK